MSLVNRKVRPIKRGEATFRDDRLFIIACDDTYAPKQYFDFFKIPRVQVHVVPTEESTSAAKYVLDRLLAVDCEPDDERWLLLDTDHCTQGSHFRGFVTALSAARKEGIKIALSKPCFELWLLLHHVEEAVVGSLKDAGETEKKLRATLGEYNKCLLKAEHFPLANVASACRRAKGLDTTVSGGDNPANNTSRVYLIWEAMVSRAAPAQLPDVLRELLDPAS